jgi:hypothetical protein
MVSARSVRRRRALLLNLIDAAAILKNPAGVDWKWLQQRLENAGAE